MMEIAVLKMMSDNKTCAGLDGNFRGPVTIHG